MSDAHFQYHMVMERHEVLRNKAADARAARDVTIRKPSLINSIGAKVSAFARRMNTSQQPALLPEVGLKTNPCDC